MTPLRKKMVDDMTVRGLADNTIKSYTRSVIGLSRHYGRSPEHISAPEVQNYLLFLHTERHLSWASCNCIRNGIRFLYRITLGIPNTNFYVPSAKQPSRLPEILNQEELARLFAAATNLKHRALLMTAYAAGLRSSELIHLRGTDIDSGRMLLRINQGKGNKDRTVPLSPRLLKELRDYWRRTRPADILFPSRNGRHLSRKGPHYIYHTTKRKAGIKKSGGIHTLRHCYATDLLEAGVALQTIQRRLGHTSVRTTMTYLKLAQDRNGDISSPLDQLAVAA